MGSDEVALPHHSKVNVCRHHPIWLGADADRQKWRFLAGSVTEFVVALPEGLLVGFADELPNGILASFFTVFLMGIATGSRSRSPDQVPNGVADGFFVESADDSPAGFEPRFVAVVPVAFLTERRTTKERAEATVRGRICRRIRHDPDNCRQAVLRRLRCDGVPDRVCRRTCRRDFHRSFPWFPGELADRFLAEFTTVFFTLFTPARRRGSQPVSRRLCQ